LILTKLVIFGSF